MQDNMTIDKENYLNELSVIAEQIAYLVFTGQGYEVLSSRNYTHEHINKFSVTVFFTSYNDEKNEAELVDCLFLITVNVQEDSAAQEINFKYDNQKVLKAFTDKYYKAEFGVYQNFPFVFNTPNLIKLYDANFCLSELLGIEINE